MLTKSELKKQLKQRGIKVKGNYILKKDVERFIAKGFWGFKKFNCDTFKGVVDLLKYIHGISQENKSKDWKWEKTNTGDISISVEDKECGTIPKKFVSKKILDYLTGQADMVYKS